MFNLPESWVWDFWFADDGDRYHLFFLYASTALKDPDARHYRASIGHAVSPDLQNWTRIEDALVRSDAPAFDDLATWTGSVVRHSDGTWFMFYTGSTRVDGDKNVQSIGYATSPDLVVWTKSDSNPVVGADPQDYEVIADAAWHDESFRDPWVFRDANGDGWHMLITARAPTGPADDRAVVGHATSPDLREWTLRPPLTEPGQGFGQLEVTQVEVVDGHPILLFSCLAEHLSAARRATGTTGGIWAASATGPLGPFDVAGAQLVAGDELYSGRLIRRRADDRWVLLAFRHTAPDGGFLGGVTDPMPVSWDGRTLTVLTT